MMMTDAEKAATEVILGVDTHLDVHVAVALDRLGRRLGELSVPTTAKGYESLVRWAEGFGTVRCAGVEGTSSYGAAITRYLRSAAIPVSEVERPKRRHLHRNSKSDSRDAESAARAVVAGETAGEPKSADGRVEMIRVLRTARRSAVKSRTQAANQLRNLVVTAPEGLRHRLRGLSTKELVAVIARFRLKGAPNDVWEATRFALRSVARRYEDLSEEIAQLDVQLDRLVGETAPELVSLPGIGTDHAATLLIAAGDNSERLKSEASFASLWRSLSRPGFLRQGRSAPPQPRWQPGRQPGVVHDLHGSDGPRPTHQGVRRQTHCRGQEQARDCPLPEALRSQGGLPRTGARCLADRVIERGLSHRRNRRRLTIGASLR